LHTSAQPLDQGGISKNSTGRDHRRAVGTLVAPRGLWGLVSKRFGWSLPPVGYRIGGQIKEGVPQLRA
jgi:hypothetical protein